MLRSAIDIGGTFTDLVIYNGKTGEIDINKIPTDATEPWKPIINGLKNKIAKLKQLKEIRHGTTLGVNTIIEQKGFKTGILTTYGFRDLLEIGRQKRPELYNLRPIKQIPIVTRDLRLQINERIAADGSIVKKINIDDIKKAISKFKEKNIAALAILFLNSYANSSHEKKAASIMRKELPGVYFSISSEVIPEFREYERLSTTTINAYLGPVMTTYLKKMLKKLKNSGIEAMFYICQSEGGITSDKSTLKYPVRTLFSGPAAGVVGAANFFGKKYKNLIVLDMGGTSTDISLILESQPVMTTDKEINGLPIRFPTLDISTIGAGGGSIAEVDRGGFIKVGPKSAGAVPGPACYSRGGKNPTLTDANLVLGFLNPDIPLGGKVKLNKSKAAVAIKESISKQLKLSTRKSAAAILRILISNISENIKKKTSSRGLNPKDLKIIAFGGAGPMHAAFLAKELQINEVIIPNNPGVFSASGLFCSNLTMDFVRTIKGMNFKKVKSNLKEINNKGEKWFAQENIDSKNQKRLWSLDIRYRGQNYEINIPVKKKDLEKEKNLRKIKEIFHKKHLEIYGHKHEKKEIEIVNIRHRCIGLTSIKLKYSFKKEKDKRDYLKQKRNVFFPGEEEPLSTKIYSKINIPQGKKINGPAILEEIDSTIVIPPGSYLTIDDQGNTIIKTG